MRQIRVVLADDHAVLRDGLTLLINAQPDMEVVGEASDGEEAVQQVLIHKPDVVVMDVSMPGTSGIQAIDRIRQTAPNVKLAVLTRHNEPAYVQQVIKSGVRAYVLKQAATTGLIHAIRSIAAGGTYLDATLTQQAVQQFIGPIGEATTTLSEREVDVLKLLAYGHSNREIASQLGLSVKTVDTYKSRAMDKLGLYSRAALVRYALQQGWLDRG